MMGFSSHVAVEEKVLGDPLSPLRAESLACNMIDAWWKQALAERGKARKVGSNVTSEAVSQYRSVSKHNLVMFLKG